MRALGVLLYEPLRFSLLPRSQGGRAARGRSRYPARRQRRVARAPLAVVRGDGVQQPLRMPEPARRDSGKRVDLPALLQRELERPVARLFIVSSAPYDACPPRNRFSGRQSAAAGPPRRALLDAVAPTDDAPRVSYRAVLAVTPAEAGVQIATRRLSSHTCR